MKVHQYLADFKKQFDPRLLEFLARKEKEARELTPEYTEVFREIKRLIKAGGKRLRPVFIYTAFRAGGGRASGELWQACLAVELIHAFALIHDDIMDNSQTRRGEITCFKKLGVNKAILIGDTALILADELIPARVKKYFDLLKFEVCAGQWLDISNAEFNPPAGGQSSKLKIMELKTARYTIARPLQIGTALSGSSPVILKAFYEYGRNAGVAFQIKDDILDGEVDKDQLPAYLKKAKDFSQKAKKAIKDVKIREKEKEFLIGVSDFIIGRRC